MAALTDDLSHTVGMLLLFTAPFLVAGYFIGEHYKEKLFNESRRIVWLDVVAGMSFLLAVAGFCFGYYLLTKHVIFEDMAFLSKTDTSGIIAVILYVFGYLLLYWLWSMMVAYWVKFGNNAMLIFTSVCLFGVTSVYAIIDCFNYSLLWGIVSAIFQSSSFMFGVMIQITLITYHRCPRCHDTGKKVTKEWVEDLGKSIEHSIETRHRTENGGYDWGDRWESETKHYITEEYDVYKTMQNYRNHLLCNTCKHRWTDDTSELLHTDEFLHSVRTRTQTKVTRYRD